MKNENLNYTTTAELVEVEATPAPSTPAPPTPAEKALDRRNYKGENSFRYKTVTYKNMSMGVPYQ